MAQIDTNKFIGMVVYQIIDNGLNTCLNGLCKNTSEPTIMNEIARRREIGEINDDAINGNYSFSYIDPFWVQHNPVSGVFEDNKKPK